MTRDNKITVPIALTTITIKKVSSNYAWMDGHGLTEFIALMLFFS